MDYGEIRQPGAQRKFLTAFVLCAMFLCIQVNKQRLNAIERIEAMGIQLRSSGVAQAWLAGADPGVAEVRAFCVGLRLAFA